MQFSDSNNGDEEAAPPAQNQGRRGFFSYLFGSREKGISEEKKAEDGNEQNPRHGSQGTLTSANLETHNEVTAGHSESKTNSAVESDRRSNASSRSTMSRGSGGSRRSRRSAASKSSAGSRKSKASRASHISHGSRAAGGRANPETIIEEEVGEEEEEMAYADEEESFDEMRKRVDIEELTQYPPGQRQKFWEERRKAFSELPLPPPPSRPQAEDDDVNDGEASDEPQTVSISDAPPSESHTKGASSPLDESGRSNPSSPYQRHGANNLGGAGEEMEEIVPKRPIDSFTREQRIFYLKSTLPTNQRATLEQDLKSHRQLRREFKHKLTLTTLTGEKKIPIPPPRVPPSML